MRGDGSPGQLMRPRGATTLGCYSPLTIMIIHDPTEGFGSSVSFPGTEKKTLAGYQGPRCLHRAQRITQSFSLFLRNW